LIEELEKFTCFNQESDYHNFIFTDLFLFFRNILIMSNSKRKFTNDYEKYGFIFYYYLTILFFKKTVYAVFRWLKSDANRKGLTI
jgi:hypothetical protein